jgi:thioredoxin-dependent peroxiredoxin
MIDPPKATKGRRMSKKTRKKSPNTSSGKPARGPSIRSAKTPPSETRRTAASKSSNKAGKRPRNASPKASHKAPSKPLKPSSPRDSALRGTAPSTNTSAKTETGNPPAKKKPLTGKSDAAAAGQSALTDGARAPSFRLPRDGGDTVSLSDYSGKKLVLFFYPRADTPGCTREAIDFTRLASAFAESRTAILGVSADSPRTQEAFRDKHQLSVPLVSDEKHEMLEAYGVWGEKSMYGRTFQGVLRTTVLIGANGRIIKIWRNVKVDGHAEAVLAAARGS